MTEATKTDLSYQELVDLSDTHQREIEEIKNEIAQDTDNLNNPQPLFKQLQAQG